MAAPMTPAEPTRDSKIKAREDAIKRKLNAGNSKNRAIAVSKINKKTGGTKTYATQRISGTGDGFTKSDYGVDRGAAIPYQILKGTGKATIRRPSKPKPRPKPVTKAPRHSVYKVRRGDTLSGIAKKYDMDWRDIWDYNLKNRSRSTANTLRKRGPHLIFRGGTFYIPR